ncbi:hypothetical protein V8C42DRAFT_140425 [Trichoderma barbatum]
MNRSNASATAWPPGLRMDVKPCWGPNTAPSLTIRFQVCNGTQRSVFAAYTVSIAELKQPLTWQQFTTRGEAVTNQLLAPGIEQFDVIHFATTHSQKYQSPFNTLDPDATMAAHVALVASHLIRVQILVSRSDFSLLFPHNFGRKSRRCRSHCSKLQGTSRIFCPEFKATCLPHGGWSFLLPRDGKLHGPPSLLETCVATLTAASLVTYARLISTT